ncbi:MAG: hypothetical protein A2096_09770 [Spirochaetes bacterium GWF1_41_5]|nr:MAG: hypothetical protein A2096_09770 [Spirochaetes bacterium GWF1_41_5]
MAAADGLKIRQTSDLQYLAGMIAVRQNKFVSAREYLSSYLQAVPEDAEVKNLLGQIASYIEFDRGTEEFRSSNFSAACGHFKNALNYTNPDPVIRLMYANASHMAAREMPDGQEKTNALQTALEQALLAAENEASFAEAGNSIFEIYTALGRFDEARAMLKKIEIKLKNAGSDLLFKMGYSCELQNKYEEALAWYRKSLAKEKKSETLQKCFAMYRQLITLKINRGSYEQALALVSGGIREFGEDLSLRELEIKIGILKNHAMFQQYLFEGETAWHKSNYALAADYYLKAHVIDPDFPGILNSLAACYFHQADFGKSAEYYWKDYTANSVPASFNSYLQAMLKMKRYDDVVQKADEFLSRRGFYSQAHRDAVERSRLEALMQSGATGRAETILTDLVSRNNNYYFLVLLGNIYFEKKEYFKSEEQFKKAIEIDQGGFVPFFNLGVIAAKKGVWNQALEYFSIAEKLRNHPEIIFYYAKIFYHQKEYAWASDNIEKCLALDRNRLDYLWWFCRIRAAQSSYLAEAENRAKVIAGLDRCINESSDREMIFLASKLKVHLLPELILDIRFPVEEQITGTVFAGDIFIFSDTGYGINSINEITGEKLWSIRENAPLSGKMGYNGHLFYALENGTLKFIDIITGREAFKVKTYALDYHAAAEGVYFLDNQKKINLIKKNFQIENIADLGEFQARKIFPAGKNIAVCNDEKILLIDRFSGKQITNLSITPKTAAGSGEQFFYTISGRKLSAFYNTGGKPAARAEFTSDQEVLLHFCSLDEIFICTADKMYIFNIPLQKFREIVLPFAVQNAGRGQDEVIFTGSGRMAKFSCSAEKFLWEKEYSGFKNGFISIISKQ